MEERTLDDVVSAVEPHESQGHLHGSLGNGVAGVLTLGVLFPDALVAFGFLAIVCGVLVLVRRSDRSPAAALVGVTLGIVLIGIAVVSVVQG